MNWGELLSRAVLVLMLLALPARAHEVQPAVADLEIFDETVEITVRMTLEAPLAGVDLAGLANTNDAANSDAYDSRRALPPEELEAEFRLAWLRIANLITLEADGAQLTPELRSVSVPGIGNPDLPRFSTFRFGAPLPEGTRAVTFGWQAQMGALILRQQGVEEGYTAFLQDGALSDPITRSGETRTSGEIFTDYVISGFQHIIPLGLDHILFVLGLFFFALHWGPLLWQVTAFTVAHTVTLALATLGIVSIPDSWMWAVEALIAASITYVAVENILRPALGWWRPAVVFGFGLLHGLGFASVLGEFGLPAGQYVVALLSFNLGVELGQLAVILGAFLLIVAARAASEIARLDDEEAMTRDLPVIYRAVSLTGSLLIAIIGAYWTLERVGLIG